MNIGVICPSEIALRRFMPALAGCSGFHFAGVGCASDEEWYGEKLSEIPTEIREARRAAERSKAEAFLVNQGRLFDSYTALISSPELQSVYLPLPPGLHAEWGLAALRHGKHLIIEKPAATSLAAARDLVETARAKQLALHENYMFAFHDQLSAVNRIVADGEIGDLRLIRISFGFPRRAMDDFRYNRALGGGALLDCGGYTIRYASMLLGESARIVAAVSNTVEGFEVDLYGSATMVNGAGVTAQLAFGMDNYYKCDLELWGSLGTLSSGRILTAPANFTPTAVICRDNQEKIRELPADDTFRKSLLYFADCIQNGKTREESYRRILQQAGLIDTFKHLAGIKEA